GCYAGGSGHGCSRHSGSGDPGSGYPGEAELTNFRSQERGKGGLSGRPFCFGLRVDHAAAWVDAAAALRSRIFISASTTTSPMNWGGTDDGMFASVNECGSARTLSMRNRKTMVSMGVAISVEISPRRARLARVNVNSAQSTVSEMKNAVPEAM